MLGDPEVTANIYCKSCNLLNTDTRNYSTDLTYGSPSINNVCNTGRLRYNLADFLPGGLLATKTSLAFILISCCWFYKDNKAYKSALLKYS